MQERGHPAVRVGRHAAEPAGVGHLHQVQGDRGVGLLVHVELGRQVVPDSRSPFSTTTGSSGPLRSWEAALRIAPPVSSLRGGRTVTAAAAAAREPLSVES
jgi:hypothetical protein